MKYGIHIEGQEIKAVSRFTDDTLPAEFQEISEAEYNEYTSKLNPFSEWNATANDIQTNTVKEAQVNQSIAEFELINKLRNLSIEIDLTIRMGNDSTALETEFASVKAQYDTLVNGV